jgi:ABC-type transporter Mla subunit MlaD
VTAAEIVAVVLAVLVAVLAGVLVSTLSALTRSLREVREAVDQLRDDTLPLIDELHEVVDNTVDHVERVDRLITAAEGLEARVDSASRLAFRTIQSPVVKAMAVKAGVSEAGKRLRGKAAEPAPIAIPTDKARRGRRAKRKVR